MRIIAGTGLNSLISLLAALNGGGTEVFDTGARGSECNHSKQWHLDQIGEVTQALSDNSITAEQGAQAIKTLTDCMRVTEREGGFREPTIHSSLNKEDEGVRRFLNDLFNNGGQRLLESPEEKAFRLADDLHDELVEALEDLSRAVREEPEKAIDRPVLEKAANVIRRLNDALTQIRQHSDEAAPDDVVEGITELNKTIRLLNTVDRTGVKIPLVLNPNEILKTAPEALETVTDSEGGKDSPNGKTPVSTDSRGSVQRSYKPRTKPAKAQGRTGSRKRANPKRSAAQKARWAKVRAAKQAKAQAKKSRRK